MKRVILDTELRARLSGLSESTEFCDEEGRTIGRFVSVSMYRELLVAWSKAHLSDDELAQRRQEPRGRTLEQIWDSLAQR
jgi:hypothetical protein